MRYACYFMLSSNILHKTQYIVCIKRDCVIGLPCMLDMYGFLSFFVLVNFSWMSPAWHSYISFITKSLFWNTAKKWKDSYHPPPLKKVDRDELHEHRHPFPYSPCTDAFLLKVGGLESMLLAGGWGRNSSFPNGTNPSSGLKCLLLKAVCLFNTYPILVHWITLEWKTDV